MKTLVLNSGFEPVKLISWQRAICLVLANKAEIVAEYKSVVRSISCSIPMPSAVRLKKYVHLNRGIKTFRANRKNILLRDRFICQYCNLKFSSSKLTIDHVLPRSKGGDNSWQNVVTTCHACNSHKGNRTPDQAGMRLAKKPDAPSWNDLMDTKHMQSVKKWLPYIEFGKVAAIR